MPTIGVSLKSILDLSNDIYITEGLNDDSMGLPLISTDGTREIIEQFAIDNKDKVKKVYDSYQASGTKLRKGAQKENFNRMMRDSKPSPGDWILIHGGDEIYEQWCKLEIKERLMSDPEDDIFDIEDRNFINFQQYFVERNIGLFRYTDGMTFKGTHRPHYKNKKQYGGVKWKDISIKKINKKGFVYHLGFLRSQNRLNDYIKLRAESADWGKWKHVLKRHKLYDQDIAPCIKKLFINHEKGYSSTTF